MMTIACEGNNNYIQAVNQDRDRRLQLDYMNRESGDASKKSLFSWIRLQKKAER